MCIQSPQQGGSGSESSRLAGTTSNTSLISTQQECRHQSVHCDASNAATTHVTQDVHSKIVPETGSRKNEKQHAGGCEYIDIEVNGRQLTAWHTVGERGGLRDRFVAAHNRQPPWSTKAYVRTVYAIEHHNDVSSGIFTNVLHDKHPCEWTKQAVITSEEALDAYMVEVIAQLIVTSGY